MSIKLFIMLPNSIADLVQNMKKFIDKLKFVLMEKSFYSVKNFLDLCVAL